MTNSQILPPKMQAQYVKRANDGDYHYKLDSGIFIWIMGNYKTVILSDCTGTVTKMTTRETENERKSLEQYKNPNVNSK